jgi:C4-dicarboxylate-specific signal transduction histidine kinase
MMTISEKEMIGVDPKEKSIRFIHNAIEFALTLGDFQKEVNSECTPEAVTAETIKRIGSLIDFDSSAIYLVDEQTSDMQLSVCAPTDAQKDLEDELAFMIENGFVAWAIRERRGITVNSKDGSRQILLHVMATYSRIRGLFLGIFPSEPLKLQEASLEILSIILRNAVNGIESLVYSTMMRQQQQKLEEEVAQKTHQLVQYEKQLVQAQNMEAIAALCGGVAHQFNNALHGLSGNIDLISMTVQNESKMLSYIERTRPIIERMSNLTNQLIAYAQGGNFIATQVISLETLFNEVLPAIKRLIKETVQLELALTDETLSVDVDLIQIRTVFEAIVTNADEAIAGKGSIRIRSQRFEWTNVPDDIKTELTPGDYVCVGIEDDGAGMDGNTLRRLFEPFYSTKFYGRGLSMAAVSGIIKRHKGYITVSSQIEKGTRVQIYLPEVSSPTCCLSTKLTR